MDFRHCPACVESKTSGLQAIVEQTIMTDSGYICPKCKRKFFDLPDVNEGANGNHFVGGCLLATLFWIVVIVFDVFVLITGMIIGAVFANSGFGRDKKTCPFCGHKSFHKARRKKKRKDIKLTFRK